MSGAVGNSTNSYNSVQNQSQTNGQSNGAANANSELSENTFLQLMIDQLQNQDPLQPQDNTQMLAQLAQFSALEQMTTVSQMTSMSLAHQLIGTSITVDDGSGNAVSGTVSSITMNQGQPEVVISGTSYPLSQVVEMS